VHTLLSHVVFFVAGHERRQTGRVQPLQIVSLGADVIKGAEDRALPPGLDEGDAPTDGAERDKKRHRKILRKIRPVVRPAIRRAIRRVTRWWTTAW
jgi:hypothetical protein